MEGLGIVPFQDVYRNMPVLVTGHTGFKGSWLCEWLLELGASVTGVGLDPQEHELLFGQLDLSERIERDVRADIRDKEQIAEVIHDVQPAIIFHLAAQPLVRLSYDIPLETFEVNVMGTLNVLDGLRTIEHPCAAVFVTTDKCYENREWLHAYREEDAMGGHDPYSASKGCAEIAIAAYRRSFYGPQSKVQVASARAGNVIGGGDWAKDRIVPDCFRSLARSEPIVVRNKTSTRPWQHVLEPLSGYMWLGARMWNAVNCGGRPISDFSTAFNFGPRTASNRTVAELVTEILKHCQGSWVDASSGAGPHEASKLNLAIDKAFHLLGWEPTWSFEKTIAETVCWYEVAGSSECLVEMTRSQIERYARDASVSGLPWAQ